MEGRFGTRRIPDLRGWVAPLPDRSARRLLLIVVATFGLPGWAAFEARADARPAGGLAAARQRARDPRLPDPADATCACSAWASGSPTSRVDRAAPERIVAPARRSASPVEVERTTADRAAVPGRGRRPRPRTARAPTGSRGTPATGLGGCRRASAAGSRGPCGATRTELTAAAVLDARRARGVHGVGRRSTSAGPRASRPRSRRAPRPTRRGVRFVSPEPVARGLLRRGEHPAIDVALVVEQLARA